MIIIFSSGFLVKQVRQGDECLLGALITAGKEAPPRHWLPPDLHNSKWPSPYAKDLPSPVAFFLYSTIACSCGPNKLFV